MLHVESACPNVALSHNDALLNVRNNNMVPISSTRV